MPLCKRVLPREQAQITGQTHLKFPQFNILLAFWLDTELLLIKIAAPPFASISNGGAEYLLERLKKCCSHSALKNEDAVFLVFGFVLAQLQGFANLRLRQSLAKNQKSSLRIGYSIFLTALAVFLMVPVSSVSGLISAQNNPWPSR